MKSDRKVIEQIVHATEILGERKLRAQLKGINDTYHHRKQRFFWMVSVAASLLLIVMFYFQTPTVEDKVLQEMQMEDSPTLLDSASYEVDSVRQTLSGDTMND